MKRQLSYLSITLALTLGLILTVLWLSGALVQPALAQANSGIIRVSATDPDRADAPGCGSVDVPCRTIQYAIGEAQPGDEVHIAAGTYDSINNYGGHDQVVEISDTITLRGGYTTTLGGWDQADPDANPTILDADGQGRVLYVSGDVTVTVEGLSLINGDATGESSHVGSDHGGGVFVISATTTLSDCAIQANTGSTTAGGSGGGITAYTTTLTLIDCRIHDNIASSADAGYGGGVYIRDGSATLTGTWIYGNAASMTSYGYGGGLYVESSSATLIGNEIFSNKASRGAQGYGGGLNLVSSSITMTSNRVLSNEAADANDGEGGGLKVSSPVTLTMIGNEISSNTASHGGYGTGGGMHLSDGPANLVDNTFDDNWASTAADGRGGGFYCKDCDASSLTSNRIVSNTGSTAAKGYGGGFYVEDTRGLTVSGNTIEHNTACTFASDNGRGGAVYFLNGTDVTLSDNRIAENVASRHYTGYGGGVWITDGILTLQRNNLLRNTATLSPTAEGLGGALYAAGKISMTLTNNMVSQNSATSQGSGLWFGGERSRAYGRLLHNTIADNGAPPSRARLDSAPLATTGAIQAGGQGVYAAPDAILAFTNTILSGHPDSAIYASHSSTVTLESTLWFGNGVNTAGAGTLTTGANNPNQDPAYRDPASGDYHLSLGSAAIDAGIEFGVDNDFDRDPRPARSGYDIGADELAYDLQLVPDRASTALPGVQVVYSHTLSNTGVITTAFVISHSSSQGWDVTYQTPITVATEDSATLFITVTVPVAALSGTVDTTILTASAKAAPSVHDSVSDLTTVTAPPSAPPRVYLPMVLKNH